MSADAEKLLQLIHAARAHQPLPADIGPWIAKTVLDALDKREREAARDFAIRNAAALIPGRRWAKMRGVQDELEAVRSEWTLHSRFPPPRGSITAHIVDALLIDRDAPSSISQLLRILKEDDD